MKKVFIITAFFLIGYFTGDAQSNLKLFSQKFEAYQSLWPKVSLYLTFNQDKFFPGDTAYFKAYFFYDNLMPVTGKQLINLDLVDSDGASKLHILFNITDGLGQNQVIIPESLPAGVYLITAYSSWMKNFNPDLIFKRKFEITRKNMLVYQEYGMPKVIVEGGHLIRDISNRIVVQTNRSGSPIRLVNSAGEEVARTATVSNGTSSLLFVPKLNDTYSVLLFGDSIHVALPPVEEDGYSLLLTAPQNGQTARVNLSIPPGSSLQKEEVILFATMRGKIFQATNLTLNTKDFVEVHISQENLPEGIVHLSLLSGTGKLLGSRDFYCSGKNKVEATIEVDRHDFKTREQVTLELSLVDENDQPVEGEFSVSIVNAELFEREKKNSLSDELLILSQVKERFLIDHTNPNWITDLDNDLILHATEEQWEEILSGKASKPRYSFSNFNQKTGSPYFVDTGKPLPELTDIQFYFQKSKKRYQATVENGKIWLAVPDVFGTDELLYWGETFYYMGGMKHGQETANFKILWADEPFKLPSAPRSRETTTPDRYADFITKKRWIDLSYGFYASPDIRRGTGQDGIDPSPDKVNEADITINVQDYIIFPTMAELVKEVIPSLQHRKVKNKDVVRVSLPENMLLMASGDPVYFIDGIATKNTSFFLSLLPAEILTVQIITDPRKLIPFGTMGKNGIVIVKTKKGDSREPVDRSRLIAGISKPLEFRASDYFQNSHTLRPDFKSAVFWTPTLKTDSSGKFTVQFFCTDDVGKLDIRVEGRAKDGRPFSSELELNVTTKGNEH